MRTVASACESDATLLERFAVVEPATSATSPTQSVALSMGMFSFGFNRRVCTEWYEYGTE